MTDEPAKKKTSRWITVGLPLLSIGGCTAVFAYSGSGNDEPTEGMARVMCEDFVEDRLKSPGSADFQRPTVTTAGVNTWLVVGSLDAENSFGATLRMTYACTVEADGDGGWTLVDLDTSED